MDENKIEKLGKEVNKNDYPERHKNSVSIIYSDEETKKKVLAIINEKKKYYESLRSASKRTVIEEEALASQIQFKSDLINEINTGIAEEEDVEFLIKLIDFSIWMWRYLLPISRSLYLVMKERNKNNAEIMRLLKKARDKANIMHELLSQKGDFEILKEIYNDTLSSMPLDNNMVEKNKKLFEYIHNAEYYFEQEDLEALKDFYENLKGICIPVLDIVSRTKFTSTEKDILKPLLEGIKVFPCNIFTLPGNLFSKEWKEDEKNKWFGHLNESFRKPEELVEFINYLAQEGYIENKIDVKRTLAYRITGRNCPEELLDSIKWKEEHKHPGTLKPTILLGLFKLLTNVNNQSANYKRLWKYVEYVDDPNFNKQNSGSFANRLPKELWAIIENIFGVSKPQN
jgi:hypothetical protein